MHAIIMRKFDAVTGHEIPTTPEEQAIALAAIKQAIELGKLKFSAEALDDLERKAWTPEIIESWFYPRN